MKRYARKPALRNGVWVVEVVEGKSPLAPVVQTVECPGGRESAFQAWREIMKDLGYGI